MATLIQMREELRRITSKKAKEDGEYLDRMWPGGLPQMIRAWLAPEPWRETRAGRTT
mgnify:CR=1 FL=1